MPKNLRRNLLLATPCNLLFALWAPLAGVFTLETWPPLVGLLIGAALLVFTGSAWVNYARKRYAEARQRLLWTLMLDLLTVALAFLFRWLYPGLAGWQ